MLFVACTCHYNTYITATHIDRQHTCPASGASCKFSLLSPTALAFGAQSYYYRAVLKRRTFLSSPSSLKLLSEIFQSLHTQLSLIDQMFRKKLDDFNLLLWSK